MIGDISKMFREIQLYPSDRDLHRFLVRVNGNTEERRMSRVTFAPHCWQHKCFGRLLMTIVYISLRQETWFTVTLCG